MHLLHLHCIFLRQLYTYPALFGLMFLHIFLTLLVITAALAGIAFFLLYQLWVPYRFSLSSA